MSERDRQDIMLTALQRIAALHWKPGDVYGGWEAAHSAREIAASALYQIAELSR